MEREVAQGAQDIKIHVLVQGSSQLFALLATLRFQHQSLALTASNSDSQFLTFHSLLITVGLCKKLGLLPCPKILSKYCC